MKTNANILLIDSSPEIRSRIRAVILKLSDSVEIREAESIFEALQSFKKQIPDIVVMDLHLPDGRGIELIDVIGRLEPRPRIIIFTDKDYLEYKAACINEGADFFFVKQSGLSGLGEVIGSLYDYYSYEKKGGDASEAIPETPHSTSDDHTSEPTSDHKGDAMNRKATVSEIADKPDALVLSGKLTIDTVEEVRKTVIGYYATHQQIRLDLGGLEEIDLAGLQLLCAFHRTCFLDRRPFALVGKIPEMLKASCCESGFNRHVGCSANRTDSCLWAMIAAAVANGDAVESKVA